jgi:hypothetical protein
VSRPKLCPAEGCTEPALPEFGGACKRHVPSPAGPDLAPSWGPVGSLLDQRDPALSARLREEHERLLAVERERKARS